LAINASLENVKRSDALRFQQQLFHVFECYRVLLRLTYTTINSAGNDDRFVFPGSCAIGVNDVGHFLGVGFTNGTAAKTARSMGRAFTMPAFH
jgi:hypothetical protein